MITASRIKKSIRQVAKDCEQKEVKWVQKYLGTKREFLCLRAGSRVKILHQATAELKELPPKEAIVIIDQLFSTDTFEDFNFGGKLLTRLPEVRKIISMSQIEKWVSHSNGWAECDCICQSLFVELEVLQRWDEWKKAIKKFSESKNIQLRRASLVLQTKSSGKSKNPDLKKLAIETIDKLKGEKEVLITKAISWLLRALSNENKAEIKKYLLDNKDTLPAIAYRETMKKIKTGKK